MRFSLADAKMITENSTKEPTSATDEVLLKVHTSEYLESLKVLQFILEIKIFDFA